MISPAICPNCGCELRNAPTRKSRCKQCKMILFVRSSPAWEAGVRKIVCQDEAEKIDALWAEENAKRRERQRVERARAAARNLEQIVGRKLPPELVVFATCCNAPLRQGDRMRLIQAGTRREWFMVADVRTRKLVHLASWPTSMSVTDASEGDIWRPILDRSTVCLSVDGTTGPVALDLRLPPDWMFKPWQLE